MSDKEVFVFMESDHVSVGVMTLLIKMMNQIWSSQQRALATGNLSHL